MSRRTLQAGYLLVIVAIAASCWVTIRQSHVDLLTHDPEEQSPYLYAQPFVETLALESNVDMGSWETFENTVLGVSFRHPPDSTVSAAGKDYIPPPPLAPISAYLLKML